MPTRTLAPWQRDPVPSRPPENQPPPLPADYGLRTPAAPSSQTPLRPAARSVPYQQAPTIPAAGPAAAGRAWAPAGAAATSRAAAPAPPARRPGAVRASWVQLPPPRILNPLPCSQPGYAGYLPLERGDEGWVNYDPPPEAGGTGLQQTNPDGSWVVHPLSVIHPGSRVGDEGPINEAFLSTPVVYLCAGAAYALSSPVVVPDGATLHCNRAAIDKGMIQPGEGATVND